MSARPADITLPPIDVGFLDAAARQRAGVDAVRALLLERVAAHRASMERVIDDPAMVVAGLEPYLATNSTVRAGLSDIIETLLRWEQEIADRRARLHDLVKSAARRAARLNSAAVPVIRSSEALYAETEARMAAAVRDARMRAMALRALHEPGDPVGAVTGEPFDLDAYADTLDRCRGT